METQKTAEKKRSIYSWISEWAGQKKGLYVASIILAVLSVAAKLIPYYFIGIIVNMFIKKETEPEKYIFNLILILVLFLLSELFHSISTSMSHTATYEVLKNVRKQLLEKLIRMPLGRVLELGTGSLKNIIMERLDSTETTLAHLLPEFTSNLLAPVIIFIWMLVIDWRMALIALIPTALGFVFATGLFSGYQTNYEQCVNTTKVLNDTAVEYVNGIEVIKAFSRTGDSYGKFVKAAEENKNSFVVWMRRCSFWQAGTMTLLPYTLLSVLPFGALFVDRGTLDLSDFVIIVILSLGLMTPLITVGSMTDDLAATGTIFGEVTGLLEENEIRHPEVSKAEPKDNSVELKNVTFAYKDEDVIKDISLRFEPGSINAIVGPSGSGKSTIAKLIAGFWDVGSGEIDFGGADSKDISQEDIRKQVAYVSQDNYLFNESVMENIRQGRPDASDDEVKEIARKSGCYDFIMGLENGFDTVAGSSGGHLSGGERQRISIARAWLKDAPVIILDEATAYTDPENESVIEQALSKLVKGRTLIMIAHRLKTVRNADMIVVIDKGSIADTGTHDILIKKDGIYRNFILARQKAVNWKI